MMGVLGRIYESMVYVCVVWVCGDIFTSWRNVSVARLSRIIPRWRRCWLWCAGELYY